MKPNPLWRINSEWNKLRKTRESRGKLGWKLKQSPRQFTKWGKFFFSAAWKGLNTHTHALCLLWTGLGHSSGFSKRSFQFALVWFGCVYSLQFSRSEYEPEMEWKRREKRNTSISLQLLTKGGSCHAPGSHTHTHTQRYTHILIQYSILIQYIWFPTWVDFFAIKNIFLARFFFFRCGFLLQRGKKKRMCERERGGKGLQDLCAGRIFVCECENCWQAV